MNWVLLQSESLWQCNDALTFLFIFVFLSTRIFFSRNQFLDVHGVNVFAIYLFVA